jgi:hypothetical protein
LASPSYEGSAYSNAYVAWFKTIIHLRSLGISEDALLKLWNLEKKILQLLQIDAVESPTWYLDSCGKKLHRRRRLLLTNYDIKFTINANKLQLGINFHPKPDRVVQRNGNGRRRAQRPATLPRAIPPHRRRSQHRIPPTRLRRRLGPNAAGGVG